MLFPCQQRLPLTRSVRAGCCSRGVPGTAGWWPARRACAARSCAWRCSPASRPQVRPRLQSWTSGRAAGRVRALTSRARGSAEAQNCVALGQQLQNGACQSMQAQLVSNANQVLNAPCNALAQRVQQQQPSAECAPPRRRMRTRPNSARLAGRGVPLRARSCPSPALLPAV